VVPPSIRHLLEHQVAQLAPTDQALLATASVAGVEFAVAAVAAGSQQTEEDVEARCDAMARQSHLVQARGTAVWPDGTVTARYGFRHALYQELLYAQMPVSRRARWHQQIGRRLEAGYGSQARERAAELAMHFARGRDAPRAVRYLQQAADEALRRSAHREAIHHLTQAVALLPALPDALARMRQELVLQVTLGRALATTRGYGAVEAEQAYLRARELGEHVDDPVQLGAVLWGLWWVYNARAASPMARHMGEQLLHLAERQQDPTLGLMAHCALGGTLLFRGELRRAQPHALQGMARYDWQRHRALAVLCGEDPSIACHMYGALALWLLGYPDQALTTVHAADTLTCEGAHPLSRVRALQGLAYLSWFRREVHTVRQQAEVMVALATAQGFPQWSAAGTVWLGWVEAMEGNSAVGIEQLRAGMAAWDVTATQGPSVSPWLAEAYVVSSQPDEGLRLLAEAWVVIDNTEERWWEAELHRLRGELLLRQAIPDAPQAAACFQQALTVARRQQAKSWELRAAMSLSRLWQHQGKRAEARELLTPVYGWFTEGFDTADLQEAKALLVALW
jgi:predicted ATPase